MTATITARRAVTAVLLALLVLAADKGCPWFPSGPKHWERTPASVATPR